MPDPKRKIPYNYTSADDDRIIKHLFGSGLHTVIKELEKRTDTGRSSRLLHRLMGDLFILQRNAFLFQELVEHPKQCKILFSAFDADLAFIKKNAKDKRVAQVYDACKKRFNDLFEKIKKTKTNQRHLMRAVAKIIGKENLYFDPFNITAHATDATDWRLSLPVAVLRPNHESQVPEIIKAVAKLGLHLIPRGAGTGLTGGATPLTDSCVMVNTEKLNRMDEIEYKTDADGKEYAVLGLEAGVITQDAIDFANCTEQ